MEYNKEVRNIYNKYAVDQWLKYGILYGKDPISQLYDRREFKVIFKEFLKNIKFENKLVLDVAYGPGRWILEYGERGAQIIALDISHEILRSSKEKLKSVPSFKGTSNLL